MDEIKLDHTNRIKNQNVRLQKTKSALFIIPRIWYDNNFDVVGGKVAIHRVVINGDDCLVIKKINEAIQ